MAKMDDIFDDDDSNNEGAGGGGSEPSDDTAAGGKEYEVGYGKPPKASRWLKGQSGNPRGPKKGSRGLKKDLHKALNATHTIKVGGKNVTGTTQELAMLTLAMRAGSGDLRASAELIPLILKIFGPDDRGRERAVLSPRDQELIVRALARLDDDQDDGADGEEGDEA